MKRLTYFNAAISFAIAFTVSIVSCNKEKENSNSSIYGEITDPRDGKTYKTIKAGDQTWFAENLDYQLPDSLLRDEDEGWCYDFDPGNCKKYGRLYEWHAAMNACPPGWHLPTDEEWMKLEMFVGMSPFLVDDYGERQSLIGNFLKSRSGWAEGGSGNGNDTIGFAALPGGLHTFYLGGDLFQGLGEYGIWWTATDQTTPESYCRRITHYYSYIFRERHNKNQAYSVRCVKD